jgi:hypothetical protein
MKRFNLLLLYTFCFLIACTGQNSKENGTNKELTQSEIIAHVKKAINPRFKTWVLFSNGTYVIIEDSTVADIRQKAIDIMKEYGPVNAGTPAGDMSITKLKHSDGWVVGGHYYGMYTYVNALEIQKDKPTDLDIGVFGRNKRSKDGKELKVIHVNTP